MTTPLSQFEQYKLITPELCETYCTHVIPSKSGLAARTEKWIRGRNLGEGGFGTVWLEEEQENGALRAVKQISKAHTLLTSRELLALLMLREHTNLFVQLFGWFENDRHTYIAMEYIECGDLASLIRENSLTESDAKIITKQLLRGLKVMHENNFCHRDIKPMNILVVSLSPIVVKISDFGISKQIDDSTALRTTLGTPSYSAPEVLGYLSSKTSVYTCAVDIWSLGCVIHTIITKETPFPETQKLLDYTRDRILFPKTRLMEKGASSTVIKFIANLMMVQPENRPTAKRALQTPWLNVEMKTEDTCWTGSLGGVPATGSGSGRDMDAVLHDCVTLYCAIKHRNLSAFRRLCLTTRLNVNARQRGNTTLLHMSVLAGIEDITMLLLSKGADVTTQDANGKTALGLAIDGSHDGMMELLLENGAGAEFDNDSGGTILALAVERGLEVVLRSLLRDGADPNSKNDRGCLILHVATENGHEGVVKLLLENGADMEAVCECGDTALGQAAYWGHEGVVGLLLENGADIEGKDSYGRTALLRAATNGQEGVVKLLLENGANVGIKNEYGNTALVLAADVGHKGLVMLLLEARTNVDMESSLGTALLASACHGHEDVVVLLLENGADTGATNSFGTTALHEAARTGHERVMRVLLEKGANIGEKDNAERTPFALAAHYGQEGAIKILLENGADVEDEDKNGDTALHVAVRRAHEDVVKLLLANKSNMEAKNNNGETALLTAALNRHESIVKLLLENGANIEEKDNHGETALSLLTRRR